MACPIPNLGTFLAHKGLKWSLKQIFPPLYILAVLPSSSGSAISGAVVGYVTGISNSTSNSYFNSSCMNQHFPNHLVPSLLDSSLNQSLSASLLFWMYWNFEPYVFVWVFRVGIITVVPWWATGILLSAVGPIVLCRAVPPSFSAGECCLKSCGSIRQPWFTTS